MDGAANWIRALSRQQEEDCFTLEFRRLGLQAECRSLTRQQITAALELPGEEAAAALLFAACPDLQQAGREMTEQGLLADPREITQRLAHADVVQAAGLILRHSAGGNGMVRMPTAAAAPAPEADGFALLQEWAAEDRSRAETADAAPVMAIAPGEAPAFSAPVLWEDRLYRMQQPAALPEATNSAGRQQADASLSAERLAEELCLRLLDAAGNM